MIFLFALLTQAFALTNSQPALESYWNANVLIKTEAWDKEGRTTVPGYCNATFISNQKLVTAAHCVSDAQALKQFNVEIHAGEYFYKTKPDGTVVRIGYLQKDQKTVPATFSFLPSLAQRIQSQGFDVRIGPDEDMAVIQLAQPWDGVVQMSYPKVLPKEKENLLRQNLSNKMVTVTLNMNEMSMDTKRNAVLNNISFSGYFESKSSSRVEEGDSGSGLYYVEGNQYYIVGVVKGKGSNFFSDWDAYCSALPILRTQGF